MIHRIAFHADARRVEGGKKACVSFSFLFQSLKNSTSTENERRWRGPSACGFTGLSTTIDPRPLYYGPREGRGKKSSSVLRAHVTNAFIRSLAPLPRTTIATSHVYVLRGKHSSACRCSRTRSRAITVENVNNPRRYAINPRTLSIIFPGCVGTIVTTSGRGTRKNRDFVCHDYYLFASIGFNDLPFAILFPDIRQWSKRTL